MKFELLHDSIAKQVLQKTSAELLQRRKIKKQIEFKYENYVQNNKILLSSDDLDILRPFRDKIQWGAEDPHIQAFIQRSEEKVAADKKTAARNERRKILIWLTSLFSMIAIALAALALIQRDRAKLAENLANLSSIENTLSTAEKFMAQENFDEALKALDNAHHTYTGSATLEKERVFFNLLAKDKEITEKIVAKKSKIGTQIDKENYEGLKNKWTQLSTHISIGDSLYASNNDLNLEKALSKYKLALQIDTTANYIKDKIVSTEKLMFEKFELWMYRAEQFSHYSQKEQAKQSLKQAVALNNKPTYFEMDTTQLKLWNLRAERIEKFVFSDF